MVETFGPGCTIMRFLPQKCESWAKAGWTRLFRTLRQNGQIIMVFVDSPTLSEFRFMPVALMAAALFYFLTHRESLFYDKA